MKVLEHQFKVSQEEALGLWHEVTDVTASLAALTAGLYPPVMSPPQDLSQTMNASTTTQSPDAINNTTGLKQTPPPPAVAAPNTSTHASNKKVGESTTSSSTRPAKKRKFSDTGFHVAVARSTHDEKKDERDVSI